MRTHKNEVLYQKAVKTIAGAFSCVPEGFYVWFDMA
jgi:hypothetical protein